MIALDKLYDMAGWQLHSIKSWLDRLSDEYSIYVIVLCCCMLPIDDVHGLTLS